MKKTLSLIAVLFAVNALAAEPKPGAPASATFRVEGMTCGSCAVAVKHVLTNIDGVVDARVSYKEKNAVVSFDATRVRPEQIIRMFEEKLPSYTMALAASGPAETKSCAPPATMARAHKKTTDVPIARVTFYEVGLVCKAAPKIGCGSRAKPILVMLGADSRIEGVWLNEAGTRLAVAWKMGSQSLTTEQLAKLLADSEIAVHDVAGVDRPALAASFASNTGWYDASTLDRLSEQEAAVIAARLVRRLSAKTALTVTQKTTLTNAIEKSCLERFTKSTGRELDQQIVAVSKEARLNPLAIAAFREVLALGYRPLPNED